VREAPPEPRGIVLAATDPGQPYGAALPWPVRAEDGPTLRPMRAAGAVVVLVDGSLRAWLGRGGSHLLTFIALEEREARVARSVAAALAAEVSSGRRRMLFIDQVDGGPAAGSVLAPALRVAGFVETARGLLLRR